MSFREGMPVALMEAMSCGLPAVCSKIRGNTDLIEHGVVPEGVVLGIAADKELGFVAAFKNDLYNENLTMTMIAGQNPFAEGETQLQLTRSYG
jgi:glycosyltransferase involved in cell wall biosynthesis